MASNSLFWRLLTRSLQQQRARSLHSRSFDPKRPFNKNLTTALVVGGAACCFSYAMIKKFGRIRTELPLNLSSVKAKDTSDDEEAKDRPTHYREMRFRQFASVEYENTPYMTPQDFLESVTDETPRARIGRLKLTQKDVDHMLKNTPTLKKGSDNLFRKLHDKGIISYTEYLFLLCVLTKPQSGFLIAFNMFDTDGNKIVDKKEFLVLQKVFNSGRRVQKEGDQKDGAETNQDNNIHIHDTSLLVHFFGKNGKNVLKYQDFHTFMENLQSEVIEMEFMEFSKGLNTISEVEFARILLRYTNLDRDGIEQCLERVQKRMPNERGITFEDFKKFCQFLNNLDDFSIAMKMYTYAQQPVSQEEFQRAVMVCTGFTLSRHVVSTVFNILDVDGDGKLAHKEFISIMKDRLHRGARSHLMHNQNTWDTFKTCVKNEMKTF